VNSLWRHIRIITDVYDGTLPLSHFLKQYFRAHPRLGSRDRKVLSDMAYCWYRCSKGITSLLSFEKKLQVCLFLCETNTQHTRTFLPESWREWGADTPEGRIQFLQEKTGIAIDVSALIAFRPVLSSCISEQDWLHSMLRQPRLFLRVPTGVEQLNAALQGQNIAHHVLTIEYPVEGAASPVHSSCVALNNGVDVAKTLPSDSYVVQDLSSQLTGLYFRPGKEESWWDCCAGAGGKSLLLQQIMGVQLTVSDRRATILHNLKHRFRQYGVAVPEIVVTDASDLSSLHAAFADRRFDHIICDVPCSGSGTWARTPEQLYFFQEERLNHFTETQKRIAGNALRFLKPGGRLIYITCSVFAAENEMVTAHLARQSGLVVKEQELINGTANRADSMYVAVLSN
jgi:16S rRNA (cytosine967-C5)-methyltransferase